ncbi:MAG: 4Fe-4S dicluster domain-containing protein [Caldilineaceae bacterium SB0668_bin_21]|nr:4Fe-4S dicluster domain-containing protein [Caldilineaceae bacterium SB0668_bin_21]MYC20211.1 4Fe-4S dicluster domain-containing protein [Caldilineaceae bacterium SB0662_bin_25]
MFGTGLLKGLGVTLKHALDTFEDDRDSVPDRYKGSLELGNNRRVIQQPIDQEGLLTIQYPEEKRLLPERFRYIPMLIWDSEKQEDRCTACGICAKVCPPQCIWIVRDSDENGKPMTRCSDFYIDAAVCMSCSFCVEFCPFDAIKMNHDYELAVYDRYPQLVYDMAELTVPLEYYAALWPTQYEEEQARRKEEEEQKRKQEEEKAAKAAARAAAKSAAAAEESATGGAAPRRSAAELQALAKERAAQRQAQAAEGGGSEDDAAAAKRARMEELKRRAQERARARKAESGE